MDSFAATTNLSVKMNADTNGSKNALRVAKYKENNVSQALVNRLKEAVSKSEKRMNDPAYDEMMKKKQREKKKRQREKKRNTQDKENNPSCSSQDPMDISTVDAGLSSLPSRVDSSIPSTPDVCSTPSRGLMGDSRAAADTSGVGISDISDLSMDTSSTVDKIVVRFPFQNKTQTPSRQSKQGLKIRKHNNHEKSALIDELKTALDKSEDESFDKDMKIAELTKQVRETKTENNELKEALKNSDDWLKSTYKFMSPTGRKELRTAAYLAKDEFPRGSLIRIRNNTGLNFSKPPNVQSTEASELEKAIKLFAIENSCEVPDMKAAKKGKRYFFCYKLVLWMQFKSENGSDVSYSHFCRFWPDNVVKPRIEDYGSCKCEPCENSELLCSALKRQNCLSRDHDIEIMIRDSRDGDDTFEKKFKEALHNAKIGETKDTVVPYLHWEKISKEGSNRKVVHRVQRNLVCSKASDLMLEMYENLKSHLNRNAVMKKSLREQRQMVMDSDDKAFLHMDWAENLDIEIPGEIQSAFFSHNSVSIHTGYLYSKGDSGGFASLSDDGCHKAEAVHAALKPTIEKLVDKGIKHIVCASDSPTSQYRNNKNVWLTKELAKKHKITINWLYTEAGHGKSSCDGIGGTVKNLLRDLTAFNTNCVISNAKDVFQLIKSHTTIDLYWHTKKDIADVMDSLPRLSSLKGARLIHQVCYDVAGNVKAKSLPTDLVFETVTLKILRNNINIRRSLDEDNVQDDEED